MEGMGIVNSIINYISCWVDFVSNASLIILATESVAEDGSICNITPEDSYAQQMFDDFILEFLIYILCDERQHETIREKENNGLS